MRREAVLAAAVSLLGSQVATAQVDAVEWRVEDGGNGHWYWTTDAVLRWPEMSDAATLRGATLVSITSQAEQDFVDALLSEGIFWIGGRRTVDPPTPFNWYWTDGSDWAWTNFSPGEPSGCNPCGQSYFLLHVRGFGWDDTGYFVNGSTSHPGYRGILEWSADCDQNGLVDYGEIVRGEKTDANANGVPDCCESPAGCCPCDIDGDGAVNGIDLAIVLARWGGPAKDYPKADADGNGAVDGADLALVLGAWGACE